MQKSQWWEGQVRPDLSQGDIVGPIPIVSVTYPPKYLQKNNFRGNISGLLESLEVKKEKDGRISVFSAGHLMWGIVLSHDCDVDKPKENKTVLVASIGRIEDVPQEHQETITSQSNIPRMFLPSVPSIGDCYAALRTTVYVPRDLVDSAPRIASMSDQARDFLQARIVAFFTRRKLPPA